VRAIGAGTWVSIGNTRSVRVGHVPLLRLQQSLPASRNATMTIALRGGAANRQNPALGVHQPPAHRVTRARPAQGSPDGQTWASHEPRFETIWAPGPVNQP